jgi:hypothetical protein
MMTVGVISVSFAMLVKEQPDDLDIAVAFGLKPPA